MKRFAMCWVIGSAALISGCGGPDAPETGLEAYVNEWKDNDYGGMYEHFTKETKSSITKKEFTEQYENIMSDIEMDKLKVELPTEEDVTLDNEQTARLPLHIEMDTIAGPLSFEKEAVMKLEETDEGEEWLIDWDPSFLLPEYDWGDKVRIQTLQAERGRIFDRNGSSLAVNGEAVSIGVNAGAIDEAGKAQLAKILGLTTEDINKQLSQSWVQDGYFVPLQTVASSNKELIQKASAVKGAATSSKAVRSYPYGAAAGHLTGYTGEINAEELKENEGYVQGDQIGKRGLEQLFEKQLKETDGIQIFIDKEKEEPVVIARKEPKNGQDIKVTINADMQKTLYEKMGGAAGTASAVEPVSGDVLALVSSPSFDPNEFARGIPAKRYTTLQDDPKQPLLNRFAAAYSPGSTMKPITASVAMKAGRLDPTAGKTISGLQWQKDASWGNYRVTRVSESTAPVTLESALVASDNIYFAMAALDTGADGMKAGLESFGFGVKYPFDYPVRESQISNNGEFDSDILLADTGYGQGEVLTSMTHLANAYGAFLNKGTIMTPRLLLDDEPSAWQKELITEEQAAIIKQGLRGVVERGTARAANIEGMAVSGKTGTAEIKQAQGTTGKENGLFVSYDANNPSFVLALLVEDVAEAGGSKVAVDKARDFYVQWKTYRK
ncbi:penicillin-binding transpeptidase domain-containing protein [Domibacillus robiginosus]|uniref:penicillin-binding transpeptidase domain-containing protein n=1 Tax=Domibacillus robiginosus TaxID=1071054 RepID=UPI00067BC706|nr:penicillin-binding transpeptidase domain-containing protein [Domibacillus robiginosus]